MILGRFDDVVENWFDFVFGVFVNYMVCFIFLEYFFVCGGIVFGVGFGGECNYCGVCNYE